MPVVKYMRLVTYVRRQPGRTERLFLSGLWLAAAAAVIAGFLLRILASFTHRLDIRFGGIALIAAGGVDSGAEAYARIRAGASLVQLYSALVFEGPGLARRILTDLDTCLARDGFACVTDAVGA